MSKCKRGILGLLVVLLIVPVGALAALKSKLPVLNSISPTSTYAGGTSFTLTVTGSSFTSGSVVQWNGGVRTTTVVSSTQLQAQISSADVATAGTASVTVFTSGRFGGRSFSALSFTINPVPTTASTTTTTSTPPTTTTTTSTTAALAITTTSVPGGTAGASYPTTTLAASGGSPAYTWSLPNGGGALPPGLALTAAGAVSGTPSAAGNFSFTAQATDTAGQVAQKAFSLAVAAPPTSSGGILFQSGAGDGTLGDWDYVNQTSDVGINTNSAYVHSGTSSVQIHHYICGDSTNTTCGSAHQDTNPWLAKFFDSTNGHPNGLDHWFMRGYVYLKTPEPGGTADGIQRKIMWVQDIRGTANYSFFITSDAANGVIPLRFSTNGNVQVPAFSFWNIGTLNYNQWYCLELEVQLNTPGSSDGAVRFWVNGTQVLNQTGVNIRGSFTTGAGVISFGRQADRTNYNPVNEYRYWNDMVISTSYVGP